MNNFEKVKNSGYRLTGPRRKILASLADKPITVQEIALSLEKKHINIDTVSIYRSMELFMKMKIVQAVDIGDGKRRYELVDPLNHHHHLICNKCGSIEDINE